MSRPDLFALIAADRGMPAGWIWRSLQVVGEKPHTAITVTGYVPGGVFKSGPRAGKPNPKLATDHRTIVVTDADLTARAEQWERETGLCEKCGGERAEVVEVGVAGTKTKPCRRCKATGRAPAIGVAA